jgi:superfamily II DNA helicase RecQ
LQPKSILALTATAGPPVIRDICHALNINNSIDDDGVAVIKSDRNNIEVSAHFVTDEIERLTLVSIFTRSLFIFSIANIIVHFFLQLTLILRDSQRSTSLAHRYHSSVLGCLSSGSVIIYVWRKKDAEYIFEQLSSYDDLGKVVCYHGGMSHSDRATSQNKVSPYLDDKCV